MNKLDYEGYRYVTMSDNELADFYQSNMIDSSDFNENEYILLSNNNKIVDKFCYQEGQLRKVPFVTLGNNETGIIKPRNLQQELAFDMLSDQSTSLKLITGGFGSGKTLALCTAAIEGIDKGRFDRIVWVRNNVQVKDTDSMGALPGDAYDKLLPYVMPLADHTGGVEGLRMLIESGRLEVIPLAFLRGRSIRNAVIISSEAENLTKQHLQLLIGRVDEGSNLWLDADFKQRDKTVFEKSAGLETLVERLKNNHLFGYVNLVKTERSETAQLADLLD